MLNQVIMMGRLTQTPELKQTQGGISFVSFFIAVERNFTNQNGTRETDFFEVNAWRGTAEFIVRNFSKGRMITIIGRLENQKWQDAEGRNRVTTKINAEKVEFSGDYAGPENQPQPSTTAPAQSYATPTQRPQQAEQMRMPYNPYNAPSAPQAAQEYSDPRYDDDLPF